VAHRPGPGAPHLIGSAAENIARVYTQQLRRELERTEPDRPPEDEKRRARCVDAEATLTSDFGAFKPDRGEAWRDNEFVVAQTNDEARRHKDPTCRAFGRDSTFLGFRANFVIWDDLVTDRTIRTTRDRENLHRWWSDTAEKRLEPGGVFILQGQRIHSEDLYRDRLEQEVTDYDDDDDEPVGARAVPAHRVQGALRRALPRHTAVDPPYDPATRPAPGACSTPSG
jgi:hypothetical protein